ncbi:unnamed protein product [Allacma fusca]|uniref:Uncharacterized protein n=1 Tax=Allacma fusca TaxID=39272 RepID=A0A8J2LFK7_9HEXA|nr:unnamed protein product [Allacma fusca]
MSQEKPLIQIQSASNRMLRSPSHESISTEISLLSLSSLNPLLRIPSPNPDSRYRLTVPAEGNKSAEIYWGEEENDLIKNFGALFKFLGLPKSFSTSDISSSLNHQAADPRSLPLRRSNSELDLTQVRCSDVIFRTHFGPTSRSCSTWVAVGDVSSTSQLPSPQGRPHFAPNGGSFTPADLVRSVNKKIRQLYIRKRLLVAYRALERLSQNDFDLEKLPVVVPGTTLVTPSGVDVNIPIPKSELDSLKLPTKKRPAKEIPVTIKDVERERGRPLSKFERNMMIFNWLHSLDESAFEAVVE